MLKCQEQQAHAIRVTAARLALEHIWLTLSCICLERAFNEALSPATQSKGHAMGQVRDTVWLVGWCKCQLKLGGGKHTAWTLLNLQTLCSPTQQHEVFVSQTKIIKKGGWEKKGGLWIAGVVTYICKYNDWLLYSKDRGWLCPGTAAVFVSSHKSFMKQKYYGLAAPLYIPHL